MQRNRFLIAAICLLFISGSLSAQDKAVPKSVWRLGIEAGLHPMSYNIIVPSQVREIPKNSYGAALTSVYLSPHSNFRNDWLKTSYYVGIKPEYQLADRLSLTSGVRLSFTDDKLAKVGGFFVWELPGNVNNTNYVRIEEIQQTVYNLGIPLELRFYPRRRDHFVRQYFVVGAMFNFVAFTHTKVKFTNLIMAKHEQEIKEQLNKPDNFSSYCYLGMGLKIGKMHRPFGNLEVHFPMFSFSQSKLTSFSEYRGHIIGINTSLKIPLDF